MAISLSGYKQAFQKRESAKRIAAEAAAQQAKESKRSGWSKFLGGVGGKLLGGALTSLTGGLAAPLLGAIGSFGAKQLAHAATTQWAGVNPNLIVGDKFGYGKEEAKTLRQGLEEQARFKGDFGKEVFGKYLEYGMEGGFGEKKKGHLTKKTPKVDEYGNVIDPEDIPTDIVPKAPTIDKAEELSEAAKEFDPLTLTGASAETRLPREGLYESGALQSPIFQGQDTSGFEYPAETFGAGDIGQSYETGDTESIWNLHKRMGGGQSKYFGSEQEFTDALYGETSEGIGQSYEPNFMGGGMVSNKVPTISEYFNMQGKTLGGSNNKSLAQILGRKQHG